VVFVSSCIETESHHKQNTYRARILRLSRSQGINFKESIPPAYVARRAVMTTLLLFGS
jgi:hypothetical protein